MKKIINKKGSIEAEELVGFLVCFGVALLIILIMYIVNNIS